MFVQTKEVDEILQFLNQLSDFNAKNFVPCISNHRFNMLQVITWIGFSQGLFSAVILRTKKEPGTADKILIAWLSLLAIEFLSCGLDILIFGSPLLSSSFLLFNPAFYLYTLSLTHENFRLKYTHLLHLLPFFFFELSTYILSEPYELVNYFQQNSSLWFRVLFSLATVISWLLYNTLSALMVHKHRKKLENEFSTIEQNQRLGWLLFIVIFYNLYCGTVIILGVTDVLITFNILVLPVYNYATLLILIYILSFYGLRQTMIYKNPPQDSEVDEKTPKYSLPDERKNQIKTLLISYFEKEKPYLNPDLNMHMLSEKLAIPKHQLTEVLNATIGRNFFRFVNEYRVEAVKKMLKKDTFYSIEAIGYENGFNSKSSFFTVFKQITGQTPMQYKNGA